jgi:hypothetical protein
MVFGVFKEGSSEDAKEYGEGGGINIGLFAKSSGAKLLCIVIGPAVLKVGLLYFIEMVII